MDHDKLIEEVQRLQEWLNENDPTTENYAHVEERLIKLVKLGIEFDEACDKQLERQDRLDLERDKTMRELDLKEKEIELKNGIEAMRIEDNSVDAANRRRVEKRQAYWDLIKTGLQIGGSAVLIVLTGLTEQHVILGQHKWSLIPKIK